VGFQKESESGFQSSVLDLAKLEGWHHVHFRKVFTNGRWQTPIQGMKGSPDLLLARNGHILHIELKQDGGELSKEQREWIGAMTGSRVPKKVDYAFQRVGSDRCFVGVWRPRNWDDIEEILTEVGV